MRSTGAIAVCLWALELLLQVGNALLENGAITVWREEGKPLNKHMVSLVGVCFIVICMIWSNVSQTALPPPEYLGRDAAALDSCFLCHR